MCSLPARIKLSLLFSGKSPWGGWLDAGFPWCSASTPRLPASSSRGGRFRTRCGPKTKPLCAPCRSGSDARPCGVLAAGVEGKGESHGVGAATGHCYCWDGRERRSSAATSLVAAGFDDKDLLVGWSEGGGGLVAEALMSLQTPWLWILPGEQHPSQVLPF